MGPWTYGRDQFTRRVDRGKRLLSMSKLISTPPPKKCLPKIKTPPKQNVLLVGCYYGDQTKFHLLNRGESMEKQKRKNTSLLLLFLPCPRRIGCTQLPFTRPTPSPFMSPTWPVDAARQTDMIPNTTPFKHPTEIFLEIFAVIYKSCISIGFFLHFRSMLYKAVGSQLNQAVGLGGGKNPSPERKCLTYYQN